MTSTPHPLRLTGADVAPWLVFAGAFCVFHTIIHHGIDTDLQAHTEYVQLVNTGHGLLPVNFLLYGLVSALSVGSTNLSVLYYWMITVLATAVSLKFVVSRRLIIELAASQNAASALRLLPGGATGLAGLLLVVFVLPGVGTFGTDEYYLNRIVPTVWHNSTVIALMPAALLLYREQYRALYGREKPRTLLLIGLVILNIVIKPSFFFASSSSTAALALLSERRLSRRLIQLVLPTLVGGALVAGQAWLIYTLNYGSLQEEDSHLRIGLLQVWNWNPATTPYDLVLSFALPLAAVGLLGRALPRGPLLYPAVLCVVAVLIYASVGETGPRATHQNFIWQNVPTTYILLLTTIVQVAVAASRAPEAVPVVRYRALSYLTLLHVLSGVYYLFRVLVTRSFF